MVMAHGHLLTARVGVLIAILAVSAITASAGPDTITPPASSCYSGIAELRIATKYNECAIRSSRTRPLTAPMDFGTDLPWDCLTNLLVSVEGCKVSIISLVNSSSLLPGFACNWLEYQGFVNSANTARVAVWVRPITAAKWVLYNTNLTSWRARGTATLTFSDLEQALIKINRRDPSLPLNLLTRQPEIMQLKRDSLHFQQQLQQEDNPEAQAKAAAVVAAALARSQQPSAAGAAGGRKLRQLQPAADQPTGEQAVAVAQQPDQQAAGPEPAVESPPLPPAVLPGGAANAAGNAPADSSSKVDSATGAAQAAAAAAVAAAPPTWPVPKPSLPPGVEADIGNGLVSQPIDWQKFLADLYSSNGSPLIGIMENNTVNLFNNERCNISYEIVSGGLLGVGTVDKKTVGMFALSAIEPYKLPYIFEVDKSTLAAAATASAAGGGGPGWGSATSTAIIVILSVLGAALIASLIYLGVRLIKAPKGGVSSAAAGTPAPYNNGVGRVDGAAVSPLEHSARAHGAQGGI